MEETARGAVQEGTKEFEKTAVRVSNVSIIGNTALSLLKLFAGIFAHSGAMVSDAVHSASDVFSSVIVIVGVKMASKESDEEHPYGHERMEPVAAIVLAIILGIVGLFIGHTALEKLLSGSIEELQIPGVLALAAAIVSIAGKEAMYWYTRHYAKLLDSGALMADAWHHRSDALSSVGSLIGIAGARMGYRWLDPVASLVICVFIEKVAYDIFVDAIKKMVDQACSVEVQQGIVECARAQAGVLRIGHIQTREFGNKIYVDLEAFADGGISLTRSDEIARSIHDAIERQFTKVKHIVVVMKPETGEGTEEETESEIKDVTEVESEPEIEAEIAIAAETVPEA